MISEGRKEEIVIVLKMIECVIRYYDLMKDKGNVWNKEKKMRVIIVVMESNV
jgi:hypothetical protein